jgi:hypothetical protein
MDAGRTDGRVDDVPIVRGRDIGRGRRIGRPARRRAVLLLLLGDALGLLVDVERGPRRLGVEAVDLFADGRVQRPLVVRLADLSERSLGLPFVRYNDAHAPGLLRPLGRMQLPIHRRRRLSRLGRDSMRLVDLLPLRDGGPPQGAEEVEEALRDAEAAVELDGLLQPGVGEDVAGREELGGDRGAGLVLLLDLAVGRGMVLGRVLGVGGRRLDLELGPVEVSAVQQSGRLGGAGL